MSVYLKDPDAVLTYSQDWSDYLADGETILSSAWAIEGGDSGAGALALGSPPVKSITTIYLGTDPTRPNQLAAVGHGFIAGDTLSILGTTSTPSIVGSVKVLAAPDGDHFTLDGGAGAVVVFTVGGAQTGATAAKSTLVGAVATTFVSGGTKGQVYTLRNRIVTSAGRTDDRVLTIRVEPR